MKTEDEFGEEFMRELNKLKIEMPLIYCPKCSSTDIRQYTKETDKCNNCNHAWDIYRPFKGVE